MVPRQHLRLGILIIVSLILSLQMRASAAEVGSFIKVIKRVDFQKKGSGTAIPAQVKQPVEVKDLIRTYEVSRAQVQFLDNSMIVIAPKSRVAIEKYMFDPSKFKRSATLGLFHGVMNVVATGLRTQKEADFIIETTTATIGIRGTAFIVVSGKKFSVVYAEKGSIFVRNVNKEVGSAPGAGAYPGEVRLDPGNMTVILEGQPPSSPQPVSAQIRDLAKGLLATGFSDPPGTNALGTLPGVNIESVANDLMSRGASLDSVKEALTAVNYPGAETYAYHPPGAPPEGEVGGPGSPPPGLVGSGGGGGTGSPAE